MTALLPGAPELTRGDIPGVVTSATYLRIFASRCPDTAAGDQRAIDLKVIAGQLMAEVEEVSRRLAADEPKDDEEGTYDVEAGHEA